MDRVSMGVPLEEEEASDPQTIWAMSFTVPGSSRGRSCLAEKSSPEDESGFIMEARNGQGARRGCTTRVHWRSNWGTAPMARSCHLSQTRSSLSQNGRSVCVCVCVRGGEKHSEQTVALNPSAELLSSP